MDLKVQWLGAIALYYLLPVVVTLAILWMRWPRTFAPRAGLAVLVAWALSVAYAIYVYRPAGLRYAVSIGVEDAHMRFDNNIGAVAMVGGWLLPAATVVAFLVARRWWQHGRNQRSDV